MELILFFLYSILLFVTLYYSLSYAFKSKATTETNATKKLTNLPPGGRGWPFIGETMEYLSMARKNRVEKFILDRVTKYSSNKLFKTSYLGENMVFMCTAEGNKFLFSNENKLLRRWLPAHFDKIFFLSNKSTITEESSNLRNQVFTLFNRPDAQRKIVPIIDEAAKEHLRTYWDCKEVKVYSLAKKFTFTLSCRLMLSIQDPETLEEFEKLFNRISAGIFSYPINLPGTKLNRAIRASKEIQKKLEAMIKKRRIDFQERRDSEAATKDILAMLLWEKYKSGEEYMTETDLANRIFALILAAYDTASVTMVSVMKYLAELPEVYEGVHREQNEISSSKGDEELLNLEDIKKMKYSWNVAREVLRLQPPVSGAFREALTSFNYDGFFIPKGWKLHWTAHATHKNPEYFPEPEKFDPSRFEGNKLVPFSYVPFGGGPHICPGLEYARLQILIFMHNVITKFRWEKVFPEEQMIRDPLLVPTRGLPVRLYPHETLN